MVIDQLLDPVCVEFLLTHQIDQDAWIKIATARAHDHPAAWGQSHAGIDRFTPFDSGNAGAIAEMSDDQAIRQIAGKLMHYRFARKTMKSIALDTLQSQFPRDRKHARNLGHPSMKCGVETCRLRNPRKMFLREADNRQS